MLTKTRILNAYLLVRRHLSGVIITISVNNNNATGFEGD